MKMFFDRIETNEEVIVVHKPYFLYLFIIALILWVVADQLPGNEAVKSIASFAWFSAIIVILWRYISMRKVWGEMREAMKKGEVTMSGSKFNPSDPLIVRIPKR